MPHLILQNVELKMEAELNLHSDFVKMAKIVHFCLESVVFNHFNVYFQRYYCLSMSHIPLQITYGHIQIQIFKKIVYYCFNNKDDLLIKRNAVIT